MARNFDSFMLGSIELFCKTAELASFTAAAAQAGVTQAAVNRSVSRLEARLGVQLFVRSTRSVRLTDRGRAYYEQCRQALGQLAEAERALTGEQAVATGLVRVSLPTSYGHYRVLPILSEFKLKYPQMRLELQLTNHSVGAPILRLRHFYAEPGNVLRKLQEQHQDNRWIPHLPEVPSPRSAWRQSASSTAISAPALFTR